MFGVIYFSSNDTISNKVPFDIGERWKSFSLSVLYFQTHAHWHKHIHALQLLWQECLKMTWSDKEDWPNPKQSAVCVHKAIQTRWSHLSRALFAGPSPPSRPLSRGLCVSPHSWTQLCLDSHYFDALRSFFLGWISGFAVFISALFSRRTYFFT